MKNETVTREDLNRKSVLLLLENQNKDKPGSQTLPSSRPLPLTLLLIIY